MGPDEIRRWLTERDEAALEELWRQADAVRKTFVGDAVHLRGLIEISNYCVRQCLYCGIRRGHDALPRYRMQADEIIECARRAHSYGYGTVVLQSGEDDGLTAAWVAGVVREIKASTPLAVTLSLGERTPAELAAWRAAGADRYLLRFETSNESLYALIHPRRPGRRLSRLDLLRKLRGWGYEVGSGVMVGIPGQTYQDLVRDILLFRELDLDMIGVGPYVPHPATPLGAASNEAENDVPADALTTTKVMALARLVCPAANIPSTTALSTVNPGEGWELGLRRGANVLMPNLTPARYRRLYEIYPAKAGIQVADEDQDRELRRRLAAMGREVGAGPGSRKNPY